MQIEIIIKNVYGVEKVYPHCHSAKCFARIAGTSTLTNNTLEEVLKLGYTLKIVQPTHTLNLPN